MELINKEVVSRIFKDWLEILIQFFIKKMNTVNFWAQKFFVIQKVNSKITTGPTKDSSNRVSSKEIIQTRNVLSGIPEKDQNKTLNQEKKENKKSLLLKQTIDNSNSSKLALNLEGFLIEDLQEGEIEVSVNQPIISINLSEEMLFKDNGSLIRSNGILVLKKIAKIIKSKPYFEVIVERYCNSKSIDLNIEDNQGLILDKVNTVIEILKNNYRTGVFHRCISNDAEGSKIVMNSNGNIRILILPKLDNI